MRSLFTTLAAALAGVILLAGCAADAARDGGGDLPELTAVEALRIGSIDDPEQVFTAFWALRVAPDGRIYTLHPQEYKVLIHDSAGRRVGSFGREGEGPGEFRNAFTMGLSGDTLWLLDFAGYRFLYFDRNGEHLRTVRVPIEMGRAGDAGPPRPQALLGDGTVLGATPAMSHLIASGDLTEQHFVTLTSEGELVDTLAVRSLVNTTLQLTVEGARVSQYGSQPFADTELLAFSRSGHGMVRIERRVGPAGPAGLTVTRTTLAGDTVFVRRDLPVDTPRITDDEVDRFVSSWAERAAEGPFASHSVDRLKRAILNNLYNPGFHPPVSELVLGHDGSVWLKGPVTPDSDDAEWTALDSVGEVVGRVGLPRSLRILDARQDQVWGSERDELDVPYIVSYEIRRAGGSP